VLLAGNAAADDFELTRDFHPSAHLAMYSFDSRCTLSTKNANIDGVSARALKSSLCMLKATRKFSASL
jgi:hypothetical protein